MSSKVLDGKGSNGMGAGLGLRARLSSATSVLADLVSELEPARLTGRHRNASASLGLQPWSRASSGRRPDAVTPGRQD